MFKPLPIYIGIKYLKAKKNNMFISFSSWISILGIIIGVSILIVVLSIMNGFDEKIKNHFLNEIPQLTIINWNDKSKNWISIRKKILYHNNIIGIAPFIYIKGIVIHNKSISFISIKAIDQNLEKTISSINSKLIYGTLDSLESGKYNIIIEKSLSHNLNVSIGENLIILIPTISSTHRISFIEKTFYVSGIYKTENSFNRNNAFININDSQFFKGVSNNITGLQLKLNNIFLTPITKKFLQNSLSNKYYILDWTTKNKNFFQTLKIEKTIMFLLLSLITIVASFNMLSSLIMLITEKSKDIAILQTIGFQKKDIILMFLTQGICIGMIGILFGVIIGVLISKNITQFISFLEKKLHTNFIQSSIYYTNFLPSHIMISDILYVVLISIILTIVTIIYPAYKASCIEPSEILKYE